MDQLKAAWKGIQTDKTAQAPLRAMLQENRHPVLKSIRRQMIIEIVAFSAILLVYYDFFDGDRRPFYLNLLLAGALLFAIVHSITGYRLARRKIAGDNLRQALEKALSSLQRFAVISVTSRITTAVCLLLFFCATITFNAAKYLLLAGLIVVLVIQGWILVRMWAKRIRQLRSTIGSLKEG
ncbi:hypothetical protein [Chitinophaga sp. XS-30]|uniref:hypothetical protein n=1 Tax=Chitinophaga sp. XS-30 TaxID=2604421 RepID=UPI0011DE16B0|nr:hypothetical protein [Chitinophaga sp. XS-30]QEH42886.1 hypothetical protein FW415_19240 [Chitinophaga sp. XS-30]